MPYSPDWEKEFDEIFLVDEQGVMTVGREAVKFHIRSLLQAREEKMRINLENARKVSVNQFEVGALDYALSLLSDNK